MARERARHSAPPFVKGGLGGIQLLLVDSHPLESPLAPLFLRGGHTMGTC